MGDHKYSFACCFYAHHYCNGKTPTKPADPCQCHCHGKATP